MAERQGLALHKSRRRDPLALDYAMFSLKRGDEIVARDLPTLDAVEAVLTGPGGTTAGLRERHHSAARGARPSGNLPHKG